ncbi:MAG: ribosomal RNA small subunit methyltransferase A [Candidatus Zixiibacteriota bacterium]|nr:MAG: ribosomal RNA small subunit methyltransferase A [candidate division Zixibacteria bacterium]
MKVKRVPFKKPQKRFSQNFLTDPGIARKIVDQLGISPADTVFEIGGGRGILTSILAESGARLFSFEIDRSLAGELKEKFKDRDNVEIVNVDFLKVEPEQYQAGEFKLIGNIPYDITSPLFHWILKYRGLISRVVITTQRELAQRISSGPGGKNWAPISIFTQCHFKVRAVMTIPSGAFYPKPKVHSSTLLLNPSAGYEIENWDNFEKIVRASFMHRRKLLVNNLSEAVALSKEELEAILVRVGLDKIVRAEQLSIEDFIRLAREFKSLDLS